jgi:2-dehydro-3-deoxyphosphogluconate aldolase/(4S)-4-hydroxy-2-oxoglutarate aldolase
MRTDHAARLEEVLSLGPVIPVLVLDDVRSAVPLARALIDGGLRVLEITLRTPAALDAARAIRDSVPDAVVGVGTVLTPAQYAAAEAAGMAFAVSPGATTALLDAARDGGVPLLTGAATASETMALLERGHRHLKFFPAEPSGGTAYLAALASPLPAARFCPTGGITGAIAPAYLALPNVVCVGGSFMVPKGAVAAGDWDAVRRGAAAAAALRPAPTAS